MTEIVNLRTVRKAKARATSAAEADRNRVAFGRTRAAKREAAMDKERLGAKLDGHRRDDR